LLLEGRSQQSVGGRTTGVSTNGFNSDRGAAVGRPDATVRLTGSERSALPTAVSFAGGIDNVVVVSYDNVVVAVLELRPDGRPPPEGPEETQGIS
jgi:hypothetical protein